MAMDIGPRIGIDGEAEFRKQINEITQQIKTFGTELKVAASEMDSNDKSVENLAKQNEILNKSIDAQEKKLEELQKGLKKAADKFGSADTRTQKWKQAVNNATADLNKMKRKVSENTSEMNKLEKEEKEGAKAAKNLEKNTEDVADAMDDSEKSTSRFGDALKASLAADAIESAISGIINGLKGIAEESREYRRIMGSLEISSEQAGYNAGQTAQAYDQLYGVLANNQTAATTTANLQALNLEQEKLNELINGTVGAWARYGDSIPIDGLAESINETVKTGQVTGNFADVLNWAGTSEDDFNEKLKATKDSTERANIVLQELARQGLMDAGEKWQENNESLVAANKATANYEKVTAQLGETVEPIFTEIQQAINSVLGIIVQLAQKGDIEELISRISVPLEFVVGVLQQIADGSMTVADGVDLLLQAMIENITESLPEVLDSGIQISGKLLQGIVSGIPEILELGRTILLNLTQGISQQLTSILEISVQTISEFLKGIISELPELIDTGTEMIGALIQGISDMIPVYIAQAPKLIGELVEELINNLPQILESGVKLLGELIAGIIETIPQLYTIPPLIIKSIVETLMEHDWGETGKDILNGLAEGILGGVTTVIDAAKEAGGKIKKAFEEFFDIHSPSRVMRDEIGKQITAGIVEGVLADKKNAEKSAEEISSAIVSAAQKTLDNYQVYNTITLSEETAFWNEMRQKVNEGTQARIDADKKYFDAKKKLDSQIISIEKKYKDSVSAVYKELSDNISEAWENYNDQVDSLTDSIRSQLGLFEEFDYTTEQTADSLISNLESQVEGIQMWRDSLARLGRRGIPNELMEELEGMGASAAGEIKLLSEMTEDELENYVSLWLSKNNLAKEAAQKQSQPLLEETREQIEDMRQAAKEELQAYQDEFVESMQQIGVALIQPLEQIKNALVQGYIDTVGTVADTVDRQANDTANQEKYAQVAEGIIKASEGLPEEFYGIGVDTINGIINGINSQSSSLYAVMEQIAENVIKTAQSALEIHSPSRIMKDFIGKNIITGLAEGITGYQGLAMEAAKKVYGNVFDEFNVPKTANGTAAAFDKMAKELGNIKVVLSDGTLVGKLTPKIDVALGGYTKMKGRYYT